MPYIWPAFSSKRRIRSIWRSAAISWSLENSGTWLSCMPQSISGRSSWRPSWGPSSAGLVLATAIRVLWAHRGGPPSLSRNRRIAEAPGLLRNGMGKAAQRIAGKIILGIARGSSRLRWVGRRRPPRTVHQGEIARRNVIEQGAGLFVEHVGIELAGAQQRHPALPLRPVELELVELGRQSRDLAVDVLFGLDPAIAAIGVDAEIADQERGQNVEAERGEERTQTLTGDHSTKMAAADLKLH